MAWTRSGYSAAVSGSGFAVGEANFRLQASPVLRTECRDVPFLSIDMLAVTGMGSAGPAAVSMTKRSTSSDHAADDRVRPPFYLCKLSCAGAR
jgi:hypothetical protein